MKRDEAVLLEGKPVIASCVWGSYVGILKKVEIRERKSWRGTVIIKSIYDFPLPIWGRFVYPIKYDTERSFGHCNIYPFPDDIIPDYKQSMIKCYDKCIKSLENHPDTLVQRGVASLKKFEWLVKHPKYMGGFRSGDIPLKQNEVSNSSQD